MRSVGSTGWAALRALWLCGSAALGGCGSAGDPRGESTDPEAGCGALYGAWVRAFHKGRPERCDGRDDDCDGRVDEDALDAGTVYVDLDGDGFGDGEAPLTACVGPGLAAVPGDCDDRDPGVSPGAPEVCDGGRDDDCDPTTDEDRLDGVTTWIDSDGDGYGDAIQGQTSCVGPGASWIAGDCDDGDPRVHPGAPERCAHGDDDCDPLTTDDDGYDALAWYADADGDGHGDPLDAVVRCARPPDRTAAGDDCDDLDPNVFPGNAEVCDGGLDNDCDARTDEHQVVRWYRDVDGDGYGVDADPVPGCTAPSGYVARAGDCDDDDPALNPSLTPGCVQTHCGGVVASQTWKATVRHRVTCDVVVDSEIHPRLTIEDGVDVRFERGTALIVGRGRGGTLIVDGDDRGVLFASAGEAPLPGDWDGVVLGRQDGGSVVRGLTVRYAGRGGQGGIVVEGGSPVFEGVQSHHNRGQGLYVAGGTPLVVRSQLTENTGGGVWIGPRGGLSRTDLDGDDGPSFADNLVSGNAGRPIALPAPYADELSPTSTFVGNAIDEIRLLGGRVGTRARWYDHAVPYEVADRGVVEVDGGPDAVLTVDPGVTVRFGFASGLEVGARFGGKLAIAGTAELPVELTGTVQVVRVDEAWDGLVFGPNDLGSELTHVHVSYGGGGRETANILVDRSKPVLWSITSELSKGSGLVVVGEGAAPQVRDGNFVRNEGHGVYVAPEAGLARSPLRLPLFVNNLCTSNGGSPIVLPPSAIGDLDPSSQFVGNAAPIRVHAGAVTEDAVWRPMDEEYEVAGPIEIGGEQAPVVTITDGVTMRFAPDASLGAGVVEDGSLLIDAETDGVVFDSAAAEPAAGDWLGVRVGRTVPDRPATSLVGLTIAHAGGGHPGDAGALELVDRDGCATAEPAVNLRQVVIRGSATAGVYARSLVSFSAEDLAIHDTAGGCFDVRAGGGAGGADGDACLPDVLKFEANDCAPGQTFGWWPLDRVALLDATSTYPGEVAIEDRHLATDVTMPPLPVPYRVAHLLRVAGAAGPVLTVSTGAVLTFHEGAGIEVGVGEPGGLVALGATFTSAAFPPAPGDWSGVRIGAACTDVALAGSTIAWGGANGVGNLWFDGCAHGAADNVLSAGSSACGVYAAAAGAGVTLAGLVVSSCVGGDVCP